MRIPAFLKSSTGAEPSLMEKTRNVGSAGGSERSFSLFGRKRALQEETYPVFGQALATTLAHEYPKETLEQSRGLLPKALLTIVTYLNVDTALETEGIFRKPGGAKKLKQLRDALERNPELTIAEMSEEMVFAMASLLKQYLREIPGGLIPATHYDRFLAAKEDVPAMARLASELEQANYYVLRYILVLMKRVVEFSAKNKMLSSTLALVLAPNIFSPPKGEGDDESSNELNALVDNMRGSSVLMTMMEHFDVVFLQQQPWTLFERELCGLRGPEKENLIGGGSIGHVRTNSTSTPASASSLRNPNSVHQAMLDDLKTRMANRQPAMTQHDTLLTPSELALSATVAQTPVGSGSPGTESPEIQTSPGGTPMLAETRPRIKASRLPAIPAMLDEPVPAKDEPPPQPPAKEGIEFQIPVAAVTSSESLRSIIRDPNSAPSSPSKQVRFAPPSEHQRFLFERPPSSEEDSSDMSSEEEVHAEENITVDAVKEGGLNQPALQDDQLVSSEEEESQDEERDSSASSEEISGSVVIKSSTDSKLALRQEPVKPTPPQVTGLIVANMDVPNGSITIPSAGDVEIPHPLELERRINSQKEISVPEVVANQKLASKMEKLRAIDTLLRQPIPSHAAKRVDDALPVESNTKPFTRDLPVKFLPSTVENSASSILALLPVRSDTQNNPVLVPEPLLQKSMTYPRPYLSTSALNHGTVEKKFTRPRKPGRTTKHSSLDSVAQPSPVVSNFREEAAKRKRDHLEQVAKLAEDMQHLAEQVRPIVPISAKPVSVTEDARARNDEKLAEMNTNMQTSEPVPELEAEDLHELIPITIPAESFPRLSQEQQLGLLESLQNLSNHLRRYQLLLRSIRPLLSKDDPEYEMKLEFYRELHGRYKQGTANLSLVKMYVQRANKEEASLHPESDLVRQESVVSASAQETEQLESPEAEKHAIKKEIYRLKTLLGRLQLLPTSSDVDRQREDLLHALSLYHARYQELKSAVGTPVMAVPSSTIASNAKPSVSLDAIRNEKKALQKELLAFQQRFFTANGHAPKSKKDYAPVMEMYERYRALKDKLPQ